MSEPVRVADFRETMIRKRLRGVGKLILVLSGKGGVGKSVISSALAVHLRDSGLRIGLLDADLFGPSAALLLGVRGPPKEGKGGLTPVDAGGVGFMSLDLFAPGRAYPLTGEATRQVIVEILALANWGKLDYLIVDMPPATGDIMMTVASLPKKEMEAIVVATPDLLSVSVARRVLDLLRTWRVPVAGVVGNMYRSRGQDGGAPEKLAREFGTKFLARLPYDRQVQKAVEASSVRDLLRTDFGTALSGSVATRYVGGRGSKRHGRRIRK